MFPSSRGYLRILLSLDNLELLWASAIRRGRIVAGLEADVGVNEGVRDGGLSVVRHSTKVTVDSCFPFLFGSARFVLRVEGLWIQEMQRI